MYKKVIVIVLAVNILATVVVKSDATKCNDDSLQCLEDQMVKYIDKLESKKTMWLVDDFLAVAEKSAEKQVNDDDVRRFQERHQDDLMTRAAKYLESHELRLTMPSSTARSLIEESRSSKLKKLILPLLLLLKLKAAIVVPAVLSLIALVAFKGLGAGLAALAISGATALKSLLESHQGNSKLTYEVVPQIAASPHWSRMGIESLPQSYHTIPY